MSDDRRPDPRDYLRTLALWALGVVAVVAASLVNALVQRWAGPAAPPVPPPPTPSVFVVGPEGQDVKVTVIRPQP